MRDQRKYVLFPPLPLLPRHLFLPYRLQWQLSRIRMRAAQLRPLILHAALNANHDPKFRPVSLRRRADSQQHPSADILRTPARQFHVYCAPAYHEEEVYPNYLHLSDGRGDTYNDLLSWIDARGLRGLPD